MCHKVFNQLLKLDIRCTILTSKYRCSLQSKSTVLSTLFAMKRTDENGGKQNSSFTVSFSFIFDSAYSPASQEWAKQNSDANILLGLTYASSTLPGWIIGSTQSFKPRIRWQPKSSPANSEFLKTLMSVDKIKNYYFARSKNRKIIGNHLGVVKSLLKDHNIMNAPADIFKIKSTII